MLGLDYPLPGATTFSETPSFSARGLKPRQVSDLHEPFSTREARDMKVSLSRTDI